MEYGLGRAGVEAALHGGVTAVTGTTARREAGEAEGVDGPLRTCAADDRRAALEERLEACVAETGDAVRVEHVVHEPAEHTVVVERGVRREVGRGAGDRRAQVGARSVVADR